MPKEKLRLAFFDRWADPIAEEILSKVPTIELVRLSGDDDPKKVWAALEAAHGYQWPHPKYLGGRALVERCPSLLAISSQGSGCDRMDFGACTEAGVMIVNQSGLGGRNPVAGHALAMMLSLSKQLVQSDRAMRRDRNWTRLQFTGEDLDGKVVGIVGFGNIGTRLAEMCRQIFEMRVLVYDPYLTAEHVAALGAHQVDLDTLIAESDFISVHCPLTEETRGMFRYRQFAKMKPGAFFINNARGGIHDEDDLAKALVEGKLAGAGLDVFEEEPPHIENPLLKLDNVVVSPHIAGVTFQGYRTNAAAAATQWITIFEGKKPPRLCNPDVWPKYVERYERIFHEQPSAG